MIYGYDKTFHRTGHVDVELDPGGKVVSVWFRCMTLPFTATSVGNERARDMEGLYKQNPPPEILAIDFKGDDTERRAVTFPAEIVRIMGGFIDTAQTALDRVKSTLGNERMRT